jgi:heme-degrading monooxygenase HmoA
MERPGAAVIFTSCRTTLDAPGYQLAAERMLELVQRQPGYLGMESFRQPDGKGITVSWWTSLEAAALWKQNAEHLQVQQLGREVWYQQYELRVCSVVREEVFCRPES